MRRLGVLTSGGDAPGMNAAIRAVVRQGIYNGMDIYGIERGFSGLVNGEYHHLHRNSVADIIHRGGTVLRTARSTAFMTDEGRERALEFIARLQLDALVIIGGDGSFRGALTLMERGVRVVGVPGTIDNDIAGCDCSIGFDTAVNTVTDAINKVRDTATSHERIYVIEVMGRQTGFIALYAGIAGGAESIILPEAAFDIDEICRRLRRGLERGKLHSIILVAEGAARALEVGAAITARMNMETRVTILGHIQRGGTPSAFDRMLASRMGAVAVKLLLEGKNGYMTAYNGSRVHAVPMAEALSHKKPFPWDIYEIATILAI